MPHWNRKSITAVLILGAVFAAVPAQSSDYTRFLSEGSTISVEYRNGSPARVKDRDEAYFATDRFGNRYRLILKNASQSYATVGFSMLSQALGLPGIPAYPILLKRGKNGVPEASERNAVSGADGKWFPAVLKADINTASVNWSQIDGARVAELVMQSSLNYLAGFHGSIVYSAGHFISNDISNAFSAYENERGREVFNEYFAELPQIVFRGLGKGDRQTCALELDRYLTKLEKLGPGDLKKILGPALASQGAERRTEFITRIKGLRKQLKQFLATRGFERNAIANLDVKAWTDAPLVNVPDTRFDDGKITGFRQNSLSERLWAYYFSPDYHGSDEIGALIDQAASTDHGIFFVDDRFEKAVPWRPVDHSRPQFSLNPLNRKTLFLVPENDLEATNIIEIAGEAGADVKIIRRKHGVALGAGIFEKTAEALRTGGYERLVVVEMPDLKGEFEAGLKKLVKELVVVDHHYNGKSDRRNRLSSLEQVARILGWELSVEELSVGIRDRSYIYGLRDLGMSKEALLWDLGMNKPGRVEAAESFNDYVELETPYGKVYDVRSNGGGNSRLSEVMAVKFYPEIPNLLFIDDYRIWFSGNPKLVETLLKYFDHRDAGVYAHFSGGDRFRNQYWGLKLRFGTDMRPYADKVRQLLASGGAGAGYCESFLKR